MRTEGVRGGREIRRDIHYSNTPSDPLLGEQLRMSSPNFVHIIDDDRPVRESLGDLLRSMEYQVVLYRSAPELLKAELPEAPACLILDVRLPGISGLELQEYLARLNISLPIILMTGFGDILMSAKGKGRRRRLPHQADTGSGPA
jgi:CheY-like chemotaxis protein